MVRRDFHFTASCMFVSVLLQMGCRTTQPIPQTTAETNPALMSSVVSKAEAAPSETNVPVGKTVMPATCDFESLDHSVAAVDYVPDPIQLRAIAAREDLLQSFSDLISTNSGFGSDAPNALDDVELEQTSGYTLEQLEQYALERNPTLTAAGSATAKAGGLREQVGTRPNPTLGYFGQQLADRDTDQHGVFIEQEFVRGNKLQLNREILSHTLSAQRWEMQTQRHRVLTDVRVRFYEAIAAQRRAIVTREFASVADRGVRVAEDRQRAEEGNLVEVLQAKTLLSEIQLAAEQAEIDYLAAWQDLAAVAGVDDAAPARLVEPNALPSASPDWDAMYQQILAESPERSAAESIVCEKYALLKRQRVQQVPNLTGQLAAGYDRGTDSGMINVQFAAPIPVWNQNTGNVSAAYADYTRAIEEVRRVEQSIKSRLARAAQEFDTSLVAVTKYQNEIIPQAKKSLELSEEAYRSGELEFLQVLVVRRSYFESAVRLIAAQARLAQADANVRGLLLSGGLDSARDFTDGDGIRGASIGAL